MRILIGAILLLIIFILAVWSLLLIWDINILQGIDVKRALLTLGLFVIYVVILLTLGAFFFNTGQRAYDRSQGRIAHPKVVDRVR
ncbi:hypothetical protein PT300_12420 [Enterobacteriaceae bacterium ESL0689]|nr:hypothetical protein [Enterobacteriaceae bacterium ESL0689]